MVKILLLTAKFETGFQSFALAMRHWEMNPNQDARQASIKRL